MYLATFTANDHYSETTILSPVYENYSYNSRAQVNMENTTDLSQRKTRGLAK